MTAPITAPIKVLDLDGWRRSVWEWDAQIRHLLRATAGPLRSTRSGADLRSGGKLNPNLLGFLGAVGVLTCWFARNTRRNVVTN